MAQARPAVGALLLCDLIIRDEGTRRTSLIVSELRFRLGPVNVERSGVYELHLLADDRLIATRSFGVIQSLEDF